MSGVSRAARPATLKARAETFIRSQPTRTTPATLARDQTRPTRTDLQPTLPASHTNQGRSSRRALARERITQGPGTPLAGAGLKSICSRRLSTFGTAEKAVKCHSPCRWRPMVCLAHICSLMQQLTLPCLLGSRPSVPLGTGSLDYTRLFKDMVQWVLSSRNVCLPC